MLGLWIDSLDDAERDAIIEHPDPTYGGECWWSDRRNCGCLVGAVVHLDSLRGEGSPFYAFVGDPKKMFVWGKVGQRFLWLTGRFGAERVWRACKLRAAKRNGVDVEGGALAAVGAP